MEIDMQRLEPRGHRAAFRMATLDDAPAGADAEPAYIRHLWSESHKRFITLKVTQRALNLIKAIGVDEVLRRAQGHLER